MRLDAKVRLVGRFVMKNGEPWAKAWDSSRSFPLDDFETQKEGFVWGVNNTVNWVAHKGRIFQFEDCQGLDREEIELLIEHFLVSLNQHFKSIQRQVKAFENLDRLIHRDPIAESVRIYVWQRDGGKCVECGRRDALEFDHIIPVSEGGSSTERNIQLLCLRCNRTKGAKV